MTPQEHEGNKKLANFIGATVCNTYEDHVLYDYSTAQVLRNFGEPVKGDNYPDDYKRYHPSTLLKYHSDWNWIHDTWNVLRKKMPDTNAAEKLHDVMIDCFLTSDKERAFNTLLEFVTLLKT